MAELEATERLVQKYMVSEREEEVSQLISGIDNGEWSLIHLIKSLGEYLTSETDAIRLKGLQLLTSVTSQCNRQKITPNSLRVLTTYYCDKVEDPALISPTLSGLLSLCQIESMEAKTVQDVIRALSTHLDMRTLVQSTRHSVFRILDCLVAIHRQALKAMGDSFVSAWLKLASGEKDPRNLISVFAIYRVILIEFSTQSHLDDIFDNTFCYLPITFRPPPNDPYGISTTDLVDALRSVITATSEFGPKAVPLFLEKLTLGSPSIRRDILQTVEISLPIYGRFVAAKHAEELWRILKVEIFQPTDPTTQKDALGALRSLITTLYTNRDENATPRIPDLVQDVTGECVEVLTEPERSQGGHAIKVVACLLRGAAPICVFVLERVLRALLKLFVQPERTSSRNAILAAISAIACAVKERESNGASEDDRLRLLQPYTDDVVGVLSVGLKQEDTRKMALLAMGDCVKIQKWFSEEELGFLIHIINEASFSGAATDDATWTSSIEMLKYLAPVVPSALESTTLPLLFSSLPDTPPKVNEGAKRDHVWQTLRALEQLCVSPTLFQTLVIRLLAKFDIVCGVRYQDGLVSVAKYPDDREERAAYCHAMLSTLSVVAEKKVANKDPDVARYSKDLLERIFNVFIAASLQSDPATLVATHTRLLQAGARIGRTITQCLRDTQQNFLLNALFKAFVRSDLAAFPTCQSALHQSEFSPFTVPNTVQHTTVVLFASCLVSLPKTSTIPVDSLDTFVSQSLLWAVSCEDKGVGDTMFKALGSLLNKKLEALPQLMDSQLDQFWNRCIADSAVSTEKRRQGVSGWTWLTKALVVRNHESAKKMIDRLLTLFADEELGWHAGLSIGVIGSKDDTFIKANDVVIKILHVQKYVQHVLPTLIQASEQPRATPQTSSLVGLTSLVKSIPRTTYEAELPRLLPLLLKSLELPEDTLKANVIETIHDAIREHHSTAFAKEYAPNLVTLMLNICEQSSVSPIALLPALKLLASLPDAVDYNVLHPYKPKVLRSLSKLLDHRKRSVRTEAVEARSTWYTFTSDR